VEEEEDKHLDILLQSKGKW